jgi:hypothetical protein
MANSLKRLSLISLIGARHGTSICLNSRVPLTVVRLLGLLQRHAAGRRYLREFTNCHDELLRDEALTAPQIFHRAGYKQRQRTGARPGAVQVFAMGR